MLVSLLGLFGRGKTSTSRVVIGSVVPNAGQMVSYENRP